MCGTDESIFLDQNIRIAPLALVEQKHDSNLDEEVGHFHHRKKLTKLFNKTSTSNIHYSQLFNKAKDQAAAESEKCCCTPEAKKKFQLIHGNAVGIVGQAGIGKSTLSKLLVREILETDLFDAEFVFYLRFRNLNYMKEMNLLQFLTNDSPLSNTLTKEDVKLLLTRLNENDNVCLVLDGFDESSVSGKSKPIKGKCSIYDSANAETIIKHLLNGDLLPRAKKLITSRPRQLFQLHKSYRLHFIVNVLGIDEAAQKQICNDVCENDDASTEVFKFVNARPYLKIFCYVPAFCILVMHCISVNFKAGKLSSTEKIDSLTTILVATLAQFIEASDHLRGEEFRTKKLSHLAYTTFVLNQLVFDYEDLKNFEISEAEASTFFNMRLGKKANMKLMKGRALVKTYFSHLLLHEFFAALYLILFMELDVFEQTLLDLKESKFEIVAKFAFGLCSLTTQQYLQEAIVGEEFNLSHVHEKKELLKKLTLKQVHSVEKFTEVAQVCGWMYELRDDKFTEEVVNILNSEFKIQLDNGLLSSDVPAYRYAFKSRKKPLYLSVWFHSYSRDHWNQFVLAFDGLIRCGIVKVSSCGKFFSVMVRVYFLEILKLHE